MAGPRARKVRDWYIIALVSGEVLVGYLRREANGFTIHRVWGGRGGGGGEGDGEGAAVHAAVREAGERVAGKREVGGGGRGGEGGGRWRGRACATRKAVRGRRRRPSATVTVWWRR